MRSVDGKYLLSQSMKLRKVRLRTIQTLVKLMSIRWRLKKSTTRFISIFSMAMYRMVAKIGFEWYCAKNKVMSKIDDFTPIIDFITRSNGKSSIDC